MDDGLAHLKKDLGPQDNDSRIKNLEEQVAALLKRKDCELSLVSPDGRNRVTICCQNTFVGLWLENNNKKEIICMYSTQDQNGIGVYHGNTPIAMSMAIGFNESAYIQYKNGNGIVVAKAEDLLFKESTPASVPCVQIPPDGKKSD